MVHTNHTYGSHVYELTIITLVFSMCDCDFCRFYDFDVRLLSLTYLIHPHVLNERASIFHVFSISAARERASIVHLACQQSGAVCLNGLLESGAVCPNDLLQSGTACPNYLLQSGVVCPTYLLQSGAVDPTYLLQTGAVDPNDEQKLNAV